MVESDHSGRTEGMVINDKPRRISGIFSRARAAWNDTLRSARVVRAAIVAAIIIGFLMVSVGPAGATNFGSTGTAGTGGTTNGVWRTNNNVFFIAKIALTGSTASGVDSAASNYNSVTGFSAFAATDTVCSDAAYDACVFDQNFGANGLAGWNTCAGTTSGSHPDQVCSVTWVRINQHYFVPLTQLACHELGHSVGLRHTSSTSSCLNTGGSASTLSTHDRAHLTNEY